MLNKHGTGNEGFFNPNEYTTHLIAKTPLDETALYDSQITYSVFIPNKFR